MRSTTYPDVFINRVEIKKGDEVTQVALKLFTRLRKQHEGNWYFIPFYKEFLLPPSNERELEAMSRFNREVYIASLTHIIDPSIKRPNGELYFKIDESDISEEDRVKSLLCFPERNPS